MAHTLGVCFSLNPKKSTSYLLLCLSMNYFFNEILRTWASLGPETRHHGFWPGSIPSRIWLWDKTQHRVPDMWVWVLILGKWFQKQLLEMERWWPSQYFVNGGIDEERMGGKIIGKNVLRNPFHNLPEKLLSAWPVPTIFIGLILGTKEIKDRRILTHLGNSY